ncbi:MAG TPA: hypothetical protein VFC16_02355 [Nakamurella sp.]|nr:hypothetical protein [Nakamurella sp.]
MPTRAWSTSATAASTYPPTARRGYFQSAIYGDPVEVTGTSVQLSADDGDIYDWALSWDQWKAITVTSPSPVAVRCRRRVLGDRPLRPPFRGDQPVLLRQRHRPRSGQRPPDRRRQRLPRSPGGDLRGGPAR